MFSSCRLLICGFSFSFLVGFSRLIVFLVKNLALANVNSSISDSSILLLDFERICYSVFLIEIDMWISYLTRVRIGNFWKKLYVKRTTEAKRHLDDSGLNCAHGRLLGVHD